MTKKEIIEIGNKALVEQFEVGQITEFTDCYICQIIPKGAELSVATGDKCLRIQKDSKEITEISIIDIDMRKFVRMVD